MSAGMVAEIETTMLDAFGMLLRVPDFGAQFLSFGHAQQQAVERIAVRLRSFHARQYVFVSYG